MKIPVHGNEHIGDLRLKTHGSKPFNLSKE